MSVEELITARSYLDDLDQTKSCNEYKTLKTLIEDEIRYTVVAAKCEERCSKGYEYLFDSDIMDIMEECDRLHVDISRKYIYDLLKENAQSEETKEYDRC